MVDYLFLLTCSGASDGGARLLCWQLGLHYYCGEAQAVTAQGVWINEGVCICVNWRREEEGVTYTYRPGMH